MPKRKKPGNVKHISKIHHLHIFLDLFAGYIHGMFVVSHHFFTPHGTITGTGVGHFYRDRPLDLSQPLLVSQSPGTQTVP